MSAVLTCLDCGYQWPADRPAVPLCRVCRQRRDLERIAAQRKRRAVAADRFSADNWSLV